MDDYSALAYRIAGGVADVRGCLILSRDGLILGSYPDDETAVKPAWVRFASLGDPERSFVEFGDQVWVYVRRPAYGAFAVANAGIRPGLVIDQLEGILTSAEESRNRRETLRVPEASGGGRPPSRCPRRSVPSTQRELHRPRPASPDSAEARHWSRATPPADSGRGRRSRGGAVAGGERRRPVGGCDPGRWPHLRSGGPRRRRGGRRPEGAGSAEDGGARRRRGSDARPMPTTTPPTSGSGTHNGKAAEAPAPMELDADAEVDPVMLAKEFSGLLQVESGDDEASS